MLCCSVKLAFGLLLFLQLRHSSKPCPKVPWCPWYIPVIMVVLIRWGLNPQVSGSPLRVCILPRGTVRSGEVKWHPRGHVLIRDDRDELRPKLKGLCICHILPRPSEVPRKENFSFLLGKFKVTFLWEPLFFTSPLVSGGDIQNILGFAIRTHNARVQEPLSCARTEPCILWTSRGWRDVASGDRPR